MQPPKLVDPIARRAALMRAKRLGQDAWFLQTEALHEVQERLIEVNRSFTDPVVISDFPDQWAGLGPLLPMTDTLPLNPGAHDLVIHAMSLHWADDPVGQLVQCRRALRPDGLLIAALFGGQTLSELRQALAEAEAALLGGLSPRVAPMAEIRDLGGLLQRAGLALPVADSLVTHVRYPNLPRLVGDLRAMAETNALAARHKATPPRRFFPEVEARYRSTFGDAEGYLPATFEIVFLTGWAPHRSQQRPLQPGSATTSLAEILPNPAKTPQSGD